MTDHPEYRGLVAAVKANPADDLPRLVLADWLDEHGSARWAEFVRAQCEVERHPHAGRIWADTFTDAEGVRAEWQAGLTSARRVREVWRAAAAEMFAGMAEEGQEARVTWNGRCFFGHPQRLDVPQYEVRRGFVERVACRLNHWFGLSGREDERIGPRLVRVHPVQRVELTDRECGQRGNSWAAEVGRDTLPAGSLPHLIPWGIAHFLAGAAPPVAHGSTRRWWGHDSPTAAADALSAAAIAWAEAQPAGG